jgi:hypothetical protein
MVRDLVGVRLERRLIFGEALFIHNRTPMVEHPQREPVAGARASRVIWVRPIPIWSWR